jgi:pectin methylesterase-like acyl-CoA thioesterase
MTIAGMTFTVNQEEGPLTLSCSGSPVRNADTGITYATLQEAYDGALNGQTLQVQAILIIENLTVNRDISITLAGGYLCDFSTGAGIMTNLQGRIKTTSGGGKLILKNFELVQ